MVYDIRRLSLACVMAALTAVSAQISFKIGPVPYTMQNFAVMLAGLLLGPRYGALAMLIYIGMIAIGLPFASGGGGIGVLLGPTAGFIAGFVPAAFLAGVFRRLIWHRRTRIELLALWLSTLVASIPIYALGFIVLYRFTAFSPELLDKLAKIASLFGFSGSPALVIFAASVLIFLPQDFFVDHVLAVLAYSYVSAMLRERGVEID